MTQQQGDSQLASLLRKQYHLIERLDQAGKYDVAKNRALRGGGASQDFIDFEFCTNRAVVKHERELGRSAFELKKLLADKAPGIVKSRLHQLGSHPEALKWIFESYGWAPFANALNVLPERDRLSSISMAFQRMGMFDGVADLESFQKSIQKGDL